MPTIQEWLKGETAAGVALDPVRVQAYRRVHAKSNPTAVEIPPQGSVKRWGAPNRNGGAGSELKKLLSWFGQNSSGCSACSGHAADMDRRGVDWCAANVELIVRWLDTEAAKRKVLGWSLNQVPGFQMTARSLVELAISKARQASADTIPLMTHRRVIPFTYSGGTPRFITTAQLMADTQVLASRLPEDTSEIIGIARSGLCVATMLAMLLHLPLRIFRQSTYDMVDGGNGWRLTGNTGGNGPAVVVDDTVMSGNSFKYVMPVVRKTHPNAISAAVYVNPAARVKPDLWVVDLPWPHVLEWNLFNSIMTAAVATDFDGILCADCAPQDDDDAERYRGFLVTATPKYMIRRLRIPLVVTARLEKWRPETEQWLARHGMQAEQLVMGPWPSLRERSPSKVAELKAHHFKQFMGRRHHVKPPMFVESDEFQARRIAEITQGIVVCPAAGRCFS